MSRPDPAPSSANDAAAPDSFESALERLESIVTRMEGERLPLEELLVCYEQGTRLLKSCGDYLAAAEQRIELIAKDENGQPRTTDFSSTAAAAGSENRPTDAAEPNPKSRGNSREGKSSSSAASTGKSASAAGSQSETGSGPAKPSRTNHEVSLF